MCHFSRSIELPVSVEQAFAYHEREMALDRMLPPWESIEPIASSFGIQAGNRVALRMRRLGVSLEIHALHEAYDPPRLFSDRMVKGPFTSWLHQHRFQSSGIGSVLSDEIEFQLPATVRWIPGLTSWVEKQLDAMFAYRHHALAGDMRLLKFLEPSALGKPKRIAVTGSTGMVGRRVTSLLSVLGHEVIRIVRRPSSIDHDRRQEVLWDPKQGLREPSLLENIDAVIHLAGENIAGRWTQNKKRELLQSREHATQVLVTQLGQLRHPPRAFVAASGIGFYGDCGERQVSEAEGVGRGFLGELAERWEGASAAIEAAGVRRCIGRLAMVVHPRLGAVGMMRPLFQLGLGGRLGSGKQHWTWIELDDAASAFVWMAISPKANGVYNLCSPQAVTNQSFTRVLGRVLHRPTLLPAPAWGLRLGLGEMADELLLTSCRAYPNRLIDAGFPFRGLDLEKVLRLWCGRGDERDHQPSPLSESDVVN